MKNKSKKRTVSDERSSDSDTEIHYIDSDDLEESFDDDLAGSCHGCHLSTGVQMNGSDVMTVPVGGILHVLKIPMFRVFLMMSCRRCHLNVQSVEQS
jgi:hypothetical protein